MGEQMRKEQEALKAAREVERNTPVTVTFEVTPAKWEKVYEAARSGLSEIEDEDVRLDTSDLLDDLNRAVTEREPGPVTVE